MAGPGRIAYIASRGPLLLRVRRTGPLLTGQASNWRMPEMKNWIAPLLAAGSIAVACYPALAGACESDPSKLTVEVTVDADGYPEVSMEEIRACAGDEIKWKFKQGAREFKVEFASDSPFDWKQQRENAGGTLKGTVRADAARTDPYKYTVEADGKPLDPTIVIDP
jgi:plastocyanin